MRKDSSVLKWKPYTERVAVTLQLLGVDVDTTGFSERLELKATSITKGNWCYKTDGVVSSLNVNDHIRHLLHVFLPRKDLLNEMFSDVKVMVCVHWQPDKALLSGGGPIIDTDCIIGLAAINACLVFEVFVEECVL